jgi:hypothetical protein
MGQNAIVDTYTKDMQSVENFLTGLKTPHRKVDTSWHDSMVKKAGDSFRKLTPDGPKLGGKKKTAKKTRKATARKRG